MSRFLFKALIATTALTAAMPAFAQDVPADEAIASDDEIIVRARRADERLQDVPVSVQVVSGDTLQKLAITSADEISKLAPGLTLTNAGASTVVVLRGVTWQPGSGTPATPIYYNEVPFDPANTLQSLFDVGQIEVLRGPQGTSRGAPSISGAVTITTRKPDLNEFGGYVQGLYGSGDHLDVQGAVNIPIIQDILAIRLAANIENSDGNRVYSVKSAVQPKFQDRNFRATVLLQPNDTLSFQAMYQRRKSLRVSFTQVAGTGSPGFAAIGIVPNFNGPALTLADRASVQDLPGRNPEHNDLLTFNANWEVLGHDLSYNFGRQFSRSGPSFNALDTLNILPGYEPFSSPANASLPKFSTHEIRLSSKPNPDRPFDYDIGWFSKHSQGNIVFTAQNFLPGAFGPPGAVPGQVVNPNPRYILNAPLNIGIGQVFDSFYSNLRFHISDRTELAVGGAILRDRVPVDLAVTSQAAFATAGTLAGLKAQFPAQFQPLVTSCEVAGQFAGRALFTSPAYAGVCDAAVPAGVGNTSQNNNDKYSKAIYNVSLSHKFTDDLMVYATTGTSFRTGLPAINNAGLPANLVTPKPETATSYELGFKAGFGRGFHFNAAVFQLDYKNQLTTFEGVSYFNTVTGRAAQTSLAFFRGLDAKVRGVEVELAARPVDNLTLGANLSYIKTKSEGATVPCNNSAVPITAANPINFCPSTKGEVLNTTAPFQMTLNGSYDIPVSDAFGGYLRFNVNYQGKNPNYGNFKTGSAFKSTPSYALVDLFAGITGNDAGWELGAYAKNVFNKQVELSRVLTTNTIFPSFAAPSGYDVVRANTPREYGVSLRYAFGSR